MSSLEGPGVTIYVLTQAELLAEKGPCDVDGDGHPENSLSGGGRTLVENLGDVLRGPLARQNEIIALYNASTQPRITQDAFGATQEAYVISVLDCDDDPTNNDQPGQIYYYPEQPDGVFPFDGDGGTDSTQVMEINITGLFDFEAYGDTILFPLFSGESPARGATITGSMSANLQEVENLLGCFHVLVQDMGNSPLPGNEPLTLLDAFVAPILWQGFGAADGAQPDVDIDGDGLERLFANSEGRVTHCFDGDGTPIPGTAADPCINRVADGFSINSRAKAVLARLLRPGDEGPCLARDRP
jgi:hypothetical protein